MTFIEYIHTQPVLCGICIIMILLIVAIVAYEAIWDPDRHKHDEELSSLSYLAALLTIFFLLTVILWATDYCIKQRAINGNYTVYIDGERSFTTSPKEAFLDSKHLSSYINTENGWVLCESKPEDRDTAEYFNKYNKEVPEQ